MDPDPDPGGPKTYGSGSAILSLPATCTFYTDPFPIMLLISGRAGGGGNGNEEFIKSELVIAGGRQLGGPGHKGQYFGQCGTPPKPPPTTRRVRIDREPRSRLPRRNLHQLPLSAKLATSLFLFLLAVYNLLRCSAILAGWGGVGWSQLRR